MGYAVEMYFDDYSEVIIRNMWKVLYDNGTSRFMHESNSKPHITLAVYNDDIDFNTLGWEVENFTYGIKPFTLNLLNIGVFNSDEGVVFLGPKVTEELLKIHEKFHEQMDSFIKSEWRYYLPDLWVPHCTMAVDLNKEELIKSIETVSSMFNPMSINIEKIGIVKFKPIEYFSMFKLV